MKIALDVDAFKTAGVSTKTHPTRAEVKLTWEGDPHGADVATSGSDLHFFPERSSRHRQALRRLGYVVEEP